MSCVRELVKLLSKYGIPESSDTGARFLAYLELIEKWNRRINLVGSTGWDVLGALYEEGLWAAQKYPKGPMRHLDIGSGAGFPAIPMRLANPGMSLDMIESRTNRAVFLETVCQTLGLRGDRVENCTLEHFLRQEENCGNLDSISWKALKLRRRDFSRLVGKTRVGAAFWIFHGSEMPIEGGEVGRELHLKRRETMPGKGNWLVSVYEKQVC